VYTGRTDGQSIAQRRLRQLVMLHYFVLETFTRQTSRGEAILCPRSQYLNAGMAYRAVIYRRSNAFEAVTENGTDRRIAVSLCLLRWAGA